MKAIPPCVSNYACGLWRTSQSSGLLSNRESTRVGQRKVIEEQLPPARQATRTSVGHGRTCSAGYKGYARLDMFPRDEVEPPDEGDDGSEPPTGRSTRVDEESRFTAARLTSSLHVREHGAIRPGLSVYWAVVILPQVSRSCHWPKMLTQLCIRSYIFLIINLVVQVTILTMIAKEEMIMDLYGGQMYLCDFGAFVEDRRCPENSCTGPGGTKFETGRIYSWSQWKTRTFVKQSLESLFPDKAAQIGADVDPGEYGMESYSCRWLCGFLFMLSVMDDLADTFWMLRLFIAVPTEGESWVLNRESSRPSVVRLYHEMDSVRLRMAGMPWRWKVFNAIFVWFPKALVWKITAQAGVTFLLDTGGIEDIIINSVALTFILGIDEMMFQNLMSISTKTMLGKVESYPMNRPGLHEDVSIEELAARYEQEFESWTWRDFCSLLPEKLIGVCCLTVVFGAEYYLRHCRLPEGSSIIGGFVSIDMYRPKSTDLSFLNVFFPNFFPVPQLAEKFWSMPPNAENTTK